MEVIHLYPLVSFFLFSIAIVIGLILWLSLKSKDIDIDQLYDEFGINVFESKKK